MSDDKDLSNVGENLDTTADPILTWDDITQEQMLDEEKNQEADALLGGQNENICTYPEGYKPRQPIYACRTCIKDGELAGVCYGCSENCHEGHDLIELYTKRNFCCDCGNSKFSSKCKLWEEKTPSNKRNSYDHNFTGLYCVCGLPYPPTNDAEDFGAMVQCNMCEDWFHLQHLIDNYDDAAAEEGKYEGDEMFCKSCVAKLPFLLVYTRSSHGDCSLLSDPDSCKYELMQGEISVMDLEPKTLFFKDFNWRSNLCKCSKCLAMYEANNCTFLTDVEDTLQFYIEQNQKAAMSKPPEKPVERELYDYLATKVNHDAALTVLSEYEIMKQKLGEFMKEKSQGDKVIRKEDIQDFFEDLHAAKRRRLDSNEDNTI